MEERSESVHTEYCRKLVELGKLLGYDTEIPRTGLYHLAYPDAAWYVDSKLGFAKVPLIVFEVLSTELEKGIRGSISSLLLYNSPIGILVMTTETYKHLKKSKEIDDWKKYVTDLIRALGLERRIFLWEETRVDDLLREHRGKKTDG